MEKYIGNKTSLLPLIGEFIEQRIPSANSMSDLFAGTTNVSRYFGKRGFDVSVGDLNRFSYVLAHAYVGLREYQKFNVSNPVTVHAANIERIRFEFIRAYKKQEGNQEEDCLAVWNHLLPLAKTLSYLQTVGADNIIPGVITEYYTQWGKHADFVSMRGGSGKRNYFSKENALFLDGVLKKVREWWRNGELSRAELFLLMTSIIEETVITANVNGTFHDFNRSKIWPNAKQNFFLRMPLAFESTGRVEIVNDDAISAAGYISHHDVCYIDPPYNFRQYTSYYHFLNFICAYPFIDNLNEYLKKITFVRGQNLEDDHPSDFCYKDRFTDKLREMIEKVDSKYVVLSYYSGRNHWNHWSKVDKPTDIGLQNLTEVFKDSDLFLESEIMPVLDIRKNYQSRSGEQKQLVDEYLFFGVKSSKPRADLQEIKALETNLAVGISQHFSYSFSPREEVIKNNTSIATGA